MHEQYFLPSTSELPFALSTQLSINAFCSASGQSVGLLKETVVVLDMEVSGLVLVSNDIKNIVNASSILI